MNNPAQCCKNIGAAVPPLFYFALQLSGLNALSKCPNDYQILLHVIFPIDFQCRSKVKFPKE